MYVLCVCLHIYMSMPMCVACYNFLQSGAMFESEDISDGPHNFKVLLKIKSWFKGSRLGLWLFLRLG